MRVREGFFNTGSVNDETIDWLIVCRCERRDQGGDRGERVAAESNINIEQSRDKEYIN